MKSFTRSERVGTQIQKIISDMMHKDVNDPRLDLATITAVKMTEDLKFANIFFAISGGQKNIDDASDGFKSASGFIKRELAKQLNLKYMPDIKFSYDDSFDTGARIELLLKQIQLNPL
ncbi:MAG: 30S ribosome-binding factor RbfA [Desulfobacterales bacterium]|nr:30S ribosome-binding factor RbfA [Desulfobacterales bacterium]